MEREKEKEHRQKGELGSKCIERSRERSPPRRSRTHSPFKTPRNPKDPTPEKESKEKESSEKKDPTPKKSPAKKRQTVEREEAEKAAAAALPAPTKKLKLPPPSTSTGKTGMFNHQPSGARSRQANLDKQFQKAQEKQKPAPSKETQATEDAGGVEDQSTLTPTPAVLMSASATAFCHLTQNVDDSQFRFSVPAEEGGEPDQITLDLSKCFVSTPEDLGTLSEFLESSQASLLPVQVHIFLESCVNVLKRGGGSDANARNFIWALIRDILTRCGKPSDRTALGHFHHPLYHGPIATQYEDIRPEWVRFMVENPESALAQKPELLAYVGQMICWTASYVSTALENEQQRIPAYEVLADGQTEDPLSDPQIGRAWRMFTIRNAFNPMNPVCTQMFVVNDVDSMERMLDEIESMGQGLEGFKLPPQSFGDELDSQVVYLAWDPEFHDWTNLMAGEEFPVQAPIKWINA